MQEPKRHHYIPIFYLKRWVGADNRLCEFSRPYGTRVKPLRKHPSGTAFVNGLYTVAGLPPEHAQIMEKMFMSAVDNTAASALDHMLQRKVEEPVPDKVKAVWARFIYSLILRTPEHLVWAQAKLKEMQHEIVEAEREVYLAKRTDADPPTFEEFREQFLKDPRHSDPTRQLHRFISNGRAAAHIAGMRWTTGHFVGLKYPFMTSDRPLYMTNGFAGPEGHFVMPISPDRIFIATNTVEVENSIRSMDPNEIVRKVNSRVVEQARKFVYAQDDKQLRFVQNRFGKMVQSTPLG